MGNGLDLVDSEQVVVHDAARPFVAVDAVQRTLGALNDMDAAVTAVPLDETVKRVKEGVVLETVDRSGLYRIQTPQAFRTSVLKSAHQRARTEGFTGTDDAELVERYGGSVAVVEGNRANMKMTFAEDFSVAESMLRAKS